MYTTWESVWSSKHHLFSSITWLVLLETHSFSPRSQPPKITSVVLLSALRKSSGGNLKSLSRTKLCTNGYLCMIFFLLYAAQRTRVSATLKTKQTVPFLKQYRRLKRGRHVQQNLTQNNRYIASKRIMHFRCSLFVVLNKHLGSDDITSNVVHNMLISIFLR